MKMPQRESARLFGTGPGATGRQIGAYGTSAGFPAWRPPSAGSFSPGFRAESPSLTVRIMQYRAQAQFPGP